MTAPVVRTTRAGRRHWDHRRDTTKATAQTMTELTISPEEIRERDGPATSRRYEPDVSREEVGTVADDR